MELTEDKTIQKYGSRCEHCSRNILLPYEYEDTCFSCGYNVNKRKHELSKIQRKKKFYKKNKKCRAKNILYLCRCI